MSEPRVIDVREDVGRDLRRTPRPDQPAFPLNDPAVYHEIAARGLTVREHLAAQIAGAVLTASDRDNMGVEEVARAAWALADEILKQRHQDPRTTGANDGEEGEHEDESGTD